MRKYLGVAVFFAAALWFFPVQTHAASPSEYLGKILIDVSRHGEAWYVNPQTHERVYLGRPDEALQRLKERATYVTFANISRLATEPGGKADANYATVVSGFVLAPDDLIGAPWYVDPASKLRTPLSTPFDAFAVMKGGTPVSAATLETIPVEGKLPPKKAVGEMKVKEVKSADTIVVEDGSTVKLASIDVPANPEMQEAAVARIRELVQDKTVFLEGDVQDWDKDGNRLRFVNIGEIDVNYDLVRNGLAFHNIESPNFLHAEMLIVGGFDAMQQKRGFWKQPVTALK